jgi:hypothetical protein
LSPTENEALRLLRDDRIPDRLWTILMEHEPKAIRLGSGARSFISTAGRGDEK